MSNLDFRFYHIKLGGQNVEACAIHDKHHISQTENDPIACTNFDGGLFLSLAYPGDFTLSKQHTVRS
uniref:Uncharacterized protein n=1 Tax=Anopheles arabiensis TaxID=7173 RepID=A0A182IH31_ANOAR